MVGYEVGLDVEMGGLLVGGIRGRLGCRGCRGLVVGGIQGRVGCRGCRGLVVGGI